MAISYAPTKNDRKRLAAMQADMDDWISRRMVTKCKQQQHGRLNRHERDGKQKHR